MSKQLIAVLAGVVVLVLLMIAGSLSSAGFLGGTSYDENNLVGDVYNGLAHVLMMRDGEMVGPIDTTNTVRIGSNGSTISEIKATTCDLSNANTSIAATSSGYVYCSVTGVASGDVPLVQLSTTTANTKFGAWVITSAKASTTAGMIDMMLYNGTGAAAVPSATAVGSSTNILYIDN